MRHRLLANIFCCLLTLLLVCLTGCQKSIDQPLKLKRVSSEVDYREINEDNPGQAVDVTQYLAPGKYTIVDFWSPYCPPCVAIKPRLEQLAASRRDIAVRSVNVNRPEKQGIDWHSPTILTNGVFNSLPYFKIYGPDKKLVAEGARAYEQVERSLQAEFN